MKNNLKSFADNGLLLVIFVTLLIVFPSVTSATEDEPPDIAIDKPDTTISDTSTIKADTLAVDTPLTVLDTIIYRPGQQLLGYTDITDTTNLERRLTQNPTVALFKSMVIPGWGQLGNHRYKKAIFFAALDAWMVGAAIHYGRQAADFRKQFDNATSISARNDWYGLYMDRKDERNKFTWFAVIVSFISMFDAYVDAHLSGFPEEPKNNSLSFIVRPDYKGGVHTSIIMPF